MKMDMTKMLMIIKNMIKMVMMMMVMIEKVITKKDITKKSLTDTIFIKMVQNDIYSILELIKKYGDNLVTPVLTYVNGRIMYLTFGSWYLIPHLSIIPQTDEVKIILDFINKNSGIINDFCCRSVSPIDINKYLLYNIDVFKTQKYYDFIIYLLLISYFINVQDGDTFFNGNTYSFKGNVHQLNHIKEFGSLKDEHYDIKIQCIYQYIKNTIRLMYLENYFEIHF